MLPTLIIQQKIYVIRGKQVMLDSDLAEMYGKPCFIIGGGEIYRQAMPYADTLYITHVHTVVQDADTYFPEIPDKEWTLVSTSPAATDPGSGYTYEFSVYHRKKI